MAKKHQFTALIKTRRHDGYGIDIEFREYDFTVVYHRSQYELHVRSLELTQRYYGFLVPYENGKPDFREIVSNFATKILKLNGEITVIL